MYFESIQSGRERGREVLQIRRPAGVVQVHLHRVELRPPTIADGDANAFNYGSELLA